MSDPVLKPLHWTAISKAKRAKRDSLLKWKLTPVPDDVLDVTHVPASCGILDKLELAITEADASTILKTIASGDWTSEAVTVAFCKRASIAQQVTNCLTEVCFDDAIARAKELDETFKSGLLVGPLHGLPISIKDDFKIKGWSSSISI